MHTVEETESQLRVVAVDDVVGSLEVRCTISDYEESDTDGIDRVVFHKRHTDSEADVLSTWSSVHTVPANTAVLTKMFDAYEQAIDAYQQV
jgi:hypothetical protein